MIKQHLSYLFSLETKGIKLGLERTNQLFDACANPQKNFKSIQVIGTNGKGSTSAMIANIFKVSGYKVGLYTSPHLNKINERIRINGQSIKDQDIVSFINSYKKNINYLNASFFEVMTALAVWYFKKEKVDIAILETGLGGRLDSVTACASEMLVCTSISKDHQHILGDSIIEIAHEKACALQANMVCISINHPSEIKTIFNNRAKLVESTIQYMDNIENNPYCKLNGQHQMENASLAIHAAQNFQNFNISNKDIEIGLSSTYWPGRIEKIYDNPTVYFDVAHNEASFISLCNFTSKLKGSKTLILALQKNKNITKAIQFIEETFDKIILTQTNVRNYMPADSLALLFTKTKTQIINQPEQSIQLSLENTSNTNIIIAGSHYLGPAISKQFKISFENI